MIDTLNIRIAKLQGCKVEWRYSEEDKTGGWVYIEPDKPLNLVLCTSAQFAWTLAPDFEHDLNAVVAALPDCSIFLMLTDSGEHITKLTPHPFNFAFGEQGHVYGRAGNRNLAAALAYEAYLIEKAAQS